MRDPLRPLPLRRAVPLAVAAALVLSGCTERTPDGAAEPTRAASLSSASPRDGSDDDGSTQRRADDLGLAALPEVPATDRPAALADQLDLVTATLRDRESAAADVRRAGQFQQLAVRTLATAPPAVRRKVFARLDPTTVPVTRACVRAAGLLRGMTSPQRRLPRWRIVAPPPPDVLLGHYRAAQRRTRVPWAYLAAIHLVETRMGRIRGTSTAGARGPMQFLPATWAVYGAGGDINDPRDAILAAARLLKANGAPGDMAEALFHYNPSDSYVGAVSAYARTLQRSPALYRGYWHWRVLYRHVRGTFVLPVGYPGRPAVPLPEG